MSLSGRRMIDGVKGTIGRFLRLPSPPYGDPSYWSSVYKDFTPAQTFEWGRLTLENDLLEYEYRAGLRHGESQSTTFAETINLHPQDTNKSVMMLGCGYSKLGEDMAEYGWQHISQVDMSSKAILDMSERCHEWIERDVMDCIEDDATVLSAFNAKTMDAVVDKGLVDTLFIADEHEQIGNVMNSVHRVLRPKGVFCVMSLSEPDYLLPVLLPDFDLRDKRWEEVQVQELPTAFLYKCQKVPEATRPTGLKNNRKRNR